MPTETRETKIDFSSRLETAAGEQLRQGNLGMHNVLRHYTKLARKHPVAGLVAIAEGRLRQGVGSEERAQLRYLLHAWLYGALRDRQAITADQYYEMVARLDTDF